MVRRQENLVRFAIQKMLAARSGGSGLIAEAFYRMREVTLDARLRSRMTAKDAERRGRDEQVARMWSEQVQVIEAEARARVDAEDVRCNLMTDAIRQREQDIESKGYEIRKVDRLVEEATKKQRLKMCLTIGATRYGLQKQRAFFSWKDTVFDETLLIRMQ